jgi:hypothetical protein
MYIEHEDNANCGPECVSYFNTRVRGDNNSIKEVEGRIVQIKLDDWFLPSVVLIQGAPVTTMDLRPLDMKSKNVLH